MYGTPPPSPRSAVDRFEMIIESLCRAVGNQQSRGLPGPLALLIWLYLKGTVRRFRALVARARAGKLASQMPPRRRAAPPAAPPGAAAGEAGAAGAPDARAPDNNKPRRWRLPGRQAWLCVMVPQHAAAFGSQLQHLLDDPEMIALLAMSPSFARLLRPLCRTLASNVTAGRLPPLKPRQPRAPRPPKPRKPRQKKVYWKCAKPPERGLIFYTRK